MHAFVIAAVVVLCGSSYWMGPVDVQTSTRHASPQRAVSTINYEMGVIEKPPAVAPARPVAPAPVPAPRAGYPTRGSWWTHPGSGKAGLINHLTSDGIHHGKFSRAWLETLSVAQLESLHSDHHEGRVHWANVGSSSASSARPSKSQRRQLYGTRDGKPPGAVGGFFRGLFGDPRYQYSTSTNCPNGHCPK